MLSFVVSLSFDGDACMPTDATHRPRLRAHRAHPHDPRERSRPACGRRARQALGASGRTGRRHGLVGGVPLLPEPRPPDHRPARGVLRRERRGGRSGRRRSTPAPDTGKRWLAMAGALRAWARDELPRVRPAVRLARPRLRGARRDTSAPAQRVPARLLGLMAEVEAAGLPLGPGDSRVPRAVQASFRPIRRGLRRGRRRADDARPDGVGHAARAAHPRAVRAPESGVLDYDAHFTHMMERVADDLGLP